MADTLRIEGSLETTPLLGVTSGAPTITIPIDTTLQLIRKATAEYTLEDDTVTDVELGQLDNVQVLSITVIGSKVRVRITSTDGATQSIPVDDSLMLVCQSVPITAIDLTRTASGVETTVLVFMGQTSE